MLNAVHHWKEVAEQTAYLVVGFVVSRVSFLLRFLYVFGCVFSFVVVRVFAFCVRLAI